MMWQPTNAQFQAALQHARACAPMECCGVIADGEFVPIKNTATEKGAFVMDMRAYISVEKDKKIEAIVHSHVGYPPIASDGDLAGCESIKLPWLIVSVPINTFCVIEPRGYRAPLIGRQWSWGTLDCYGIIRDGMKEYAGLDLPDFTREWLWWERGQNIIEEQFEKAGFVKVDDGFKHLDALGMRIRSDVVNHCGLFLEPNMMLHHMKDRPSARVIYGGVYQAATILHLRHRELMGK